MRPANNSDGEGNEPNLPPGNELDQQSSANTPNSTECRYNPDFPCVSRSSPSFAAPTPSSALTRADKSFLRRQAVESARGYPKDVNELKPTADGNLLGSEPCLVFSCLSRRLSICSSWRRAALVPDPPPLLLLLPRPPPPPLTPPPPPLPAGGSGNTNGAGSSPGAG